MTPPQSPKTPSDILNLGLDLIKPAPLLLQNELPISGKVEVDSQGNATYLVQIDLSFLLGGAVGARAARGLAKAGAASHAAKMAEAAAKGSASGAIKHLGKPAKSTMESWGDSIVQGLEDFFGPARSWMLEVADFLGI